MPAEISELKIMTKGKEKKQDGGPHTDGRASRHFVSFWFFFLVVVCSVRFFQLWKTTVASRDCCFSVVLPIIVYDEAGRA